MTRVTQKVVDLLVKNNQPIGLEIDPDDLKNKIIFGLENHVWARVQRSKIHGIGVFAIRDIPADTSIFPDTLTEFMFIKWEEVNTCHPAIIKMIKDYYVTDTKGFWSPPHSLNKIDPSFYLNHNKKNNCIHLPNGDIRSSKFILVGNELTLNYENVYESTESEERE